MQVTGEIGPSETAKWLQFVSALCEQPTPKAVSDLTILFLSARSDTGGGPRHLFDLLQSLEGSGIRTVVAAPDGEPYGPRFLCQADLFVPIKPRSFSILSLVRLIWVIHREKIDLIHSHGRGAGVYSRVLGLLTGRPVLHTFHGIHSAPSTMGQMKLRLDQILALLPFRAHFVSESELARAIQLRTVRKQRCELVPNAVDLRRFDEYKEVARPSLRVGTFLRADQAKGPDLWLKYVALASQHPEFDNVTFSCVGVAPKYLKKFGPLPERLIVEGELDEPAEWLQGLDIYVSTSRSEGMPLGVLEAMAARKPCLLSRIDGHQAFFKEHVAVGFSLKSSDDFISNLKSLIIDAERRKNLAQGGRRLIEAQHSLPSFRHRLLNIYFELTKSKSS